MKVAVIADIHSNFEALKSVIGDIENLKTDKIICLGDIIGKGINANKCVELVKQKCDVVLSGNAEIRFCKDNENDFKDCEDEYKRIKWNKSLLTKNNVKYLSELNYCYELKIKDTLIRFFHASPDSVFKFVNSYEKDISNLYQMFLPSSKTVSQDVADVVVYGHLHYQFLDTLYNRTIVNCGSVGNAVTLIQKEEKNSSPYQVSLAQYLLLDIDDHSGAISYNFRRVNYDKNKELASNKKNIELEGYQYEILYGKYRNMKRVNESLTKQGYDVLKF